MKFKKFITCSFILCFLLLQTNAKAQSCPTINSYAIYMVSDNGDGTCNYSIQVCWTTAGNKSILVQVSCNGTQVLNQCIGVSGTGCQSINFTCACNATITGNLTPYSGSSCNGSACGATSLTGSNILNLYNFNEKLLNSDNKKCIEWNLTAATGISEVTVEYATDGSSYMALNANYGNFTAQDRICVLKEGFYRIAGLFFGKKVYSKIFFVKTYKSGIHLYPNPATDRLNITGNIQGTTIEIHNLIGNRIPVTTTLTQEIDIRKLSKGIYYLTATGEHTKEIIKFIKL